MGCLKLSNLGVSIVNSLEYELVCHLGNVLAVVTDRKITLDAVGSRYSADVVQFTDYSPFGVELDQRHGTENTERYKFGFQGQLLDDDIKGDGNSVNYKYRMHDPRIGRFFARDPLSAQYPHNSPYAFSENRVINGVELEGLEVMECVIQVSITDPKLKTISITKLSEVAYTVTETILNGVTTTVTTPIPMTVQYVYKNAQGTITGQETLPDFKPNTAESEAIYRPYYSKLHKKTFANRILALTETKKVDGKSIAANHRSEMSGQFAISYDLSIYFKSNEAGISKAEMGEANYNKSLVDLTAIIKLMKEGASYAKGTQVAPDKLTLDKYQMTVCGETDSNPSDYKGADGKVCGNSCLGQARADNLLNRLILYHPNNNKTKTIENEGAVKAEDRNSTLIFLPIEK